MAEITRQDLVSDEALQAPVILTKEFEKLLSTVDLVIASSKKYSDALSGNTGLKETQETTKKLTDEQRVLAQVSKQIATETAKQSQVYQQQAAVLKDLKEQQKQRNVLGDKEAINVRASNASLKQLEAALKANRSAWAELTNEEQRNSQTGKQLKQAIQEQYAEVTKLNKEVGVHKDTVGDYEGAMRRLKLELKAARDEMAGIAAELGEDSKEFKDAAQKAGQLADQIGDIQQSVKAVSGTPIENFAGSFQLLTEKLKGGDFKGAASAINGISEAARGLTFKEAIAGIGSFAKALGGLGVALLTNPIFLIAATIASAVIAFKYFEAEAEKMTTAMLDRYKRERESLKDTIDHEIDLRRSALKYTLEFELAKHQAYLKTLKRQQKLEGDGTQEIYIAGFKVWSSVNEDKKKAAEELAIEIRETEQSIELLKQDIATREIKRIEEIAEKRKKISEKVAAILREIAEEEAKEEEKIEADRLAASLERLNEQEKENRKLLEGIYQKDKEDQKKRDDEEWKANDEKNKKIIESDEYVQKYREERLKRDIEKTKEALEKIKSEYDGFSSAIISLVGNISAGKIQDIDSQINAEKERANQEILLAKGNEEAKIQIKAQSELRIAALEKKKKEEQRKTAQLEKDFAIVQAGILTAVNILKVFPNPILMALAGTLGALQIAAINAKPLPQYFKGTDNHPGGYAMVGEKGVELMRMPDGQFKLTPNRPTVMDLPAGTEVIPNPETMRMLAMAGMGTPERLDSPRDQRLLNEVRELKQITAKNRPTQTNLARNMATVYEWKEESETHKRKIRALSMGDWI